MIILFDLDGTLIDSTEAILESFHHAFDVHHAAHPKDEQIVPLIGHPLDVMFADLGVSAEKVWDFVTSYKEHYRKISTQKTVLLPCARESVEEASKFARLGIVTTKTAKYSRILMEHFGMMHFFEVLIGREDVEHPKPAAEPIEKALGYFGNIEKKNVWMVGDTSMDLLSAQNAGVKSAAVLSGYGSREELSKFTSMIFNDTCEVVKYLKGINETPSQLVK